MIKLVVFDWNGVLIADAQATVEVEKEVFKAFGHAPIDLKTYRDIFTTPVKEFFIAAGFTKEEMDRNATKIQNLFHSLYEPRIANVRTRAGARQLLNFLSGQKIEAVILSNHTPEGLEQQLTRLKIKRYFSKIISNDKSTTMHMKNKSDKLVALVQDSSYKKDEILIIGDSLEEIEAARRAGIRVVSITGGYYSTKRLKAGQPDYLINNLSALIDIIKKV